MNQTRVRVYGPPTFSSQCCAEGLPAVVRAASVPLSLLPCCCFFYNVCVVQQLPMSRRTKGAPKKRTVPPTDEEEEEEGDNNGNEQQQKTPPKRVAKRKTVCPGALTVSTSPSTLVLCGVQQSKYGTCFWRTPNSIGAAPTGATISAVCCRTCGQVDHTMECCPVQWANLLQLPATRRCKITANPESASWTVWASSHSQWATNSHQIVLQLSCCTKSTSYSSPDLENKAVSTQ